MADKDKSYNELIAEFAERCYNGEFGDTPFRSDDIRPIDGFRTSPELLEAARVVFAERFPDDWNADTRDHDWGGNVTAAIEYRYNDMIQADAIENAGPTLQGVLEVLDLEAQPPMEVTTDEKFLETTGLTEDDLREAEAAFAATREEQENVDDNHQEDTTEYVSDDVANDTLPTDTPNSDRNEPTILRETEMGNPIEVEYVGKDGPEGRIIYEYNEDDSIKDAIFVDNDGSETSFSELFGEIIANNEETREICANVCTKMENGEDWKGYLQEVLDGLTENDKTDTGTDNEQEQTDFGDQTETQQATYEERFQEHSDAADARHTDAVSLRRDSFTAYHTMAKTYNAYMGGIAIDGKTVTKVDVFVSALNFMNTSIIDTLIIELLRAVLDKTDNDVDKEKRDVDFGRTDARGVYDSGYMKEIDAGAVNDVRTVIPSAGIFYGADATAISDKSTPDMTIRSTNPNNENGKGIEYTNNGAEKFTFSDLRTVELKGNIFMVDPFGRVVDVNEKFSTSDSVKIGQYFPGLDEFSSKRGAASLNDYAKEQGVTISQAKDSITATLKERFCERIESTYPVEAKALRENVLTREQGTIRSLTVQDNILGKYQTAMERAGNEAKVEEIKSQRASIGTSIKEVDKRVVGVLDRISKLDSLSDSLKSKNVTRRFADATTSEKDAVGRSAGELKLDHDKVGISENVKDGIERINTDTEKYNATKPEQDKVTFDSARGMFVDRNGITEKGQYVGNEGGKYLSIDNLGPDSPADTEKYVTERFDPDKNYDKILSEIDSADKQNDIEKPNEAEQDKIDRENLQPDVALDESADVENNGVDNDTNAATELENGNDKTDITDADKRDTEKTESDITKPEGSDIDRTEAENDKVDQSESDKADKTDNENADNTDKAETKDTEISEANKTEVEKPENIDNTAQEDKVSDIENATQDTETEQTAAEIDENATETAVEPETNDTETGKENGLTENDENADKTTTDADEAAKDTVNDDEIDDTDRSLSNEEKRDDADDVAAVADDEDDADTVEAEEHDGEMVAVSGKEAADSGNTSDKIDSEQAAASEQQDIDQNDGDTDSFKSELTKLFDDIFGLNSDSGDGITGSQIVDMLSGGQLSRFEADVDKICNLIDSLSGAENFSEIMDIFANTLTDAIVSDIEAKVGSIENFVDIGSRLIEALTNVIGGDHMADVAEEVMSNIADMGVETPVQEAADEIMNGIFGQETIAPESITIGDMDITNEGLFDAITGEEINTFADGVDLDSFADAVANDMGSVIDDGLDSIDAGDVETSGITDGVDAGNVDGGALPDTEIDEFADMGVDAGADLGADATAGTEGAGGADAVEDVDAAAALLL